MLRSYCLAHGKDWAKGLPYLMFAVREAEQESLGFSPADLVFSHTVRGPLKLLSEQLLAKDSPFLTTSALFVSDCIRPANWLENTRLQLSQE